MARAYLARLDRCLKFGNFQSCPLDPFEGNVEKARVQLVQRISSACGAAILGGTPISAFGPTVCPAAWLGCEAPVNNISNLIDCFECIVEGVDGRHRYAIDLPPLPESPEERSCITRLHRTVSKAIRTGLNETKRCAKGGVKPFSCFVDTGAETKFGKALEKIHRIATKCRDASGTPNSVSGGVRELCHRAVASTEDAAECFVEEAICSTCQLSNAMYGQGQDCAEVSADRTCTGYFSSAGIGTAFVANEADDSVTYFGNGIGYRFGTLAASTFPAGDAPTALATNGNVGLVYVASESTSSVTYLDASTGEYLDGTLLGSTFAVGDSPSALAVAGGLGILYVANAGDGTVTLLDATDGSYVYGTLAASSFDVGVEPSGLALDNTHTVLYVTDASAGTVVFLDPLTGAPLFGTLAASTFATGAGAAGVAYDWHNERILVTNRLDDTVTLLDAATGAPTFVTLSASTFPGGDSPRSVAWANGQFFFLSESDGMVHAMNDDAQIDSAFVGSTPRGLAALPGVETVYVADDGNDELVLVGDGNTRSASTFSVGSEPRAVAVSPSLDLVYVVEESADTVVFLDSGTGDYANGTLAASSFALSSGMHQEIAINETAGILYVANGTDDTVTFLNAATGAYVNGSLGASTFAAGDGPYALAVNEAADLLYVVNSAGSTVTFLDASTGAPAFGTLPASSFAVTAAPLDIAFNAAANRLFVGSLFTGELTMLNATTGAYANGTLASSTVGLGGCGGAALAVDSAANRLFVLGNKCVVMLDATTGAPAGSSLAASTFDTVYRGSDIAVDPVTKRLIIPADLGIVGPVEEPVVFMDSESGEFLATTMVGIDPIAVAVDPSAGTAYVSVLEDDGVVFIDSSDPGVFAFVDIGFSAKEASSVPLFRNAYGVAVNEADGVFYALADIAGFEEGVYYLDAATATYYFNYGDVQSSAVYLTTYDTQSDIAYNSATGLIYATKSTQGTEERGLSVLDGLTKVVVDSIVVGEDPRGVATSAADDLVYVAAFDDDVVTFLDATTLGYLYGDLASSQVPVGDGPVDVAVNEAAGIVYVANQNDASVTFLDASTGAYLFGSLAGSTFGVLGGPTGVAVDPVSNTLFVTCGDADAVVMLDANTGAYAFGTLAASTLLVGDLPFAVAVNESTGVAYVVNRDDGTVTYVDAASGAYLNGTFVGSTFAVGPYPWGVAVHSGSDVVAVTVTALEQYNHPAELVLLDGGSGGFAHAGTGAKRRVPTGAGPSAVAVMTWAQ